MDSRCTALAGALALSGACTAERDESPNLPGPPPRSTCRTDFAAALGRVEVPGLSIGVIANGTVACTAVAGSANIERGRAVTPDTVFSWASVSKTVTGAAVMILHDDGALGLDDDIDDHLPFSVRNPNCPSRPITVRQLLTHTSSIVDNDAIYDAGYTIGDSPIPLVDFVRGYVSVGGAYYDATDNFDDACPGKVNEYSNIAIGVLGYLVEHVSGTPFDEFCRTRIFEPLGMEQTSFHLANLDLARVAMPYDRWGPDFVAHGHVGLPTYPDGSLRSSVPHMARFLAMTAELGTYEGQRILSESSARELRRVQIPELDDTQALVWFYELDGTVLGHNGGDPGTSSLMFFDPSDGTGALVVGNGDWHDDDDDAPEAYALLEALLAEAKTY